MARGRSEGGPEAVLQALLDGELDVAGALERLRGAWVEDLGYARVDHDRARRRGFPEVIFAPGKRPEQVREIFLRLADRNPNVLSTRTSREAATAVLDACAEAEYDEVSRLLWLWRDREVRGAGPLLVVSAGTADQAVAGEAFQCARVMGNEAELVQDVGVAGVHRLLQEVERLRRARVIVCVAGFEAALPSVVAGLVDRPVIAVPTSAGYGASFGGLAALLASLNSCAGGVTVVNIDNGFGAAQAASLINRP
jgi:NCAIR mutase (PurE)-related protein